MSDYLSLSTANLPDPAIDPAAGKEPSDYFNTVTYSGNSSNPASVTGVGFQPDFVWAKTRSFGNTDHRLQDVVRGSNKRLESNTTDAETDAAGGIQSFDSDGFTVGDGTSKDGFIHFGSRTFVAWNWKAGGTGVSNTDGSITSTVSANTDAGFSIVGYTGNKTNGATIGHGLTSAPEFIIIKNRDSAEHWPVYHASNTSAPETEIVYLNLMNATSDNDGFWNDTAPTSSVITLGLNDRLNANNQDHIAYCFHSVEGYSKFGGYTGNGSNDGPFVYTGFRPAFLMIKRTDSTHNWYMFDSTRTTTNPQGLNIMANSSAAEDGPNNIPLDFLSNGFKPRGNGASQNASGGKYIYMAFAEMPFKYAVAE